MTLPVGSIIMWSRSLSQIPTGWAMCNGQNGTPNMTNRFIYGASGDWELGVSDGSLGHSHTMPSSTGAGGGHAHSISVQSGAGSGSIKATNQSGGTAAAAAATHSHSGSASSDSVADHTHTLSGATGSTDTLLPFLKLYYIMRIE